MAKVHHTLPPTFELVDLNSEPIQGIFYTEDLTLGASPGDDTEQLEESEPQEPTSTPAEPPSEASLQVTAEEAKD